MNILSLVNALPGAVAQGLIWGIMAIGVYITYRVLDFADLTVDGSLCTGGAVCIMLMLKGYHVWVAMAGALAAGMLCGMVTGLFHTFMGIPAILSGILTQLGLWSVNLKIMGKANQAINVDKYQLLVSLRFIKNVPFFKNTIFLVILITIVLIGILYWFFGTEIGCSIRATGNNEAMIRALGVNTDRMKIIGIVLANGLVALSGSIVSQSQRYSDVGMGTGTIVIGLASIIIGEVIFSKSKGFFMKLISLAAGSVIYRIVIAIVLRLGMNPNDLKLLTAVIVTIALSFPVLRAKTIEQKRRKMNIKKHGEGM